MKRNLLTMTLTMIMLLTFAACSQTTPSEDTYSEEETASTKTAETESETLVVGFDQDFPPMGFIGDDGEFTGFDIDLAKEAAKRLNKELILQPIAWDAKDMELESGNIDCIWNGFTINGREESYTWTEAYMANQQVFVVRDDAGISTLEDLADKVVTAQADSSAEAALNDAVELSATFAEFIKASDYNVAMMDLLSGAVDAVAMDDTVARYQIEKRGDNLVVLEEAIATEAYGVGFLLGNESLRDDIQKVLEEMTADGTMADISTAWFGKDITTIGQ